MSNYFKLVVLMMLLLLWTTICSSQTVSLQQQALSYIQENAIAWGLTLDDISELNLTDAHTSSLSGVTHIYLEQLFQGIPIRKAYANIHLKPDGSVLHLTQSLFSNLRENISNKKKQITANDAIAKVVYSLGLSTNCTLPPYPLENLSKNNSKLIFSGEALASKPIPVQLVYFPDISGKIRLCWEVTIRTLEAAWTIHIDAQSGKEVNRTDRIVRCDFDVPKSHCLTPKLEAEIQQLNTNPTPELIPKNAKLAADCSMHTSFSGQYFVFDRPVESPLYTANRITFMGSNINMTAAPFGWHDTNGDAATVEFDYTRGNHVYAYYGKIGLSIEPAFSAITRTAGAYVSGIAPQPPDCLDFNYSTSLNNISGEAFIEDAVTNLFVWNNICHDVFYLYGFDEPAGNFQETNHAGMGGLAGDGILARAQDGQGIAAVNNATFTREEDGDNPVMRMFLWNTNQPTSTLDGDFDNLVIAHEYGHGINARLINGGGNINCFGGNEHGDEGWSDFYGLMLTLQDIDDDNGNVPAENVIGEGIRGIGNYLRNDGTSGCNTSTGNGTCGLRPTAYTTDMSINPYTYGDVPNMAVPHGVGFVWCTILWEITWKLINKHGFEEDIYNTASTAGNILVLKLVIEGLKLTPCDPDFIEMRDAILAADVAVTGGANQDSLWAAFAKRGLGFSAATGSIEAFDLPTINLTKTVDKAQAEIGDAITYTLTITNNASTPVTNVNISDIVPADLSVTSISNSGNNMSGTITWPTFASIASGNSESVTFTAEIENTASITTTLYENNLENAATNTEFTPLGAWALLSDNTFAHSGNNVWFYSSQPAVTEGNLEWSIALTGNNNYLSFWHNYDLEKGYDGGVIEWFNGSEWEDLNSQILQNGYNGSVLSKTVMGFSTSALNGRHCFTGNSGGYINTILNLSDLNSPSPTRLRFRIATDEDNGSGAGTGWLLDDFSLLSLSNILNEGCAVATGQSFEDCGDVGQLGTIVYSSGVLPVELLQFQAKAQQNGILLTWQTEVELLHLGFTIERSTNTLVWKDIGWQEGKNTSNKTTSYQFFDLEAQPNIQYYYRLKRIDLDGQFEYSAVVTAMIEIEQINGLRLFPNPANGKVIVQFEKTNSQPQRITLIGLNGQPIKELVCSPFEKEKTMHFETLPSGVYFIKVQTGAKILHHKLLIQH